MTYNGIPIDEFKLHQVAFNGGIRNCALHRFNVYIKSVHCTTSNNFQNKGQKYKILLTFKPVNPYILRI